MKLPRCQAADALAALLFLLAGHAARAEDLRREMPDPLQTLILREAFGVSHPRQIVDFDLAPGIDAKRIYLTGPKGTWVPFQALSGNRVAVETDLPAGATLRWTVYPSREPQTSDDAVKVTQEAGHYEITNGLAGVRVPVPSAELAATPAPIQGIRYRDGAWTATGPNRLSAAARKMEVRFLERGPLDVVVEVAYQFDRPDLRYGNQVLIPGGEGTYRSTIEVQAGQPSILVEEDTDTDVSYSLDVSRGLAPTQARYRGHHASKPELGREADGRQYRMWHERQPMDAFVDLQYETPSQHRPMAVWDPWVYDSGWYWMLYDAAAGEGANVLGIFAGRPSRVLGAAYSGVAVFTRPEPRGAGVAVLCRRRSPDARVFPRIRFGWGIFLGAKGQELADPYQVQPIARQMNLHAGFSLGKVHRYALAYPDPPQGYGALYMPAAALQALIRRVRQDKAFFDYAYNAEPTARPLLDMWRDTTGERLREVVADVTGTAQKLLEALVHGDGIYDFHYHYWHGGLAMSRLAAWIDQALASEHASPEDKARVKAAAVLFASVLWDNDFVPLFDGHGLNLGTENMPVQQDNYRNLYALLLAGHPMMKDRVPAIAERAVADLRATLNEHGAHMACTHYVGASMGPLLSTLQQLQMAGAADAFATEPRLRRFADFYMNFLTPPEVRFGAARKVVAIGDSSTEGSELFGQLGTGFADADPKLSARLMGAWHASGAVHSGFHGSTLLKINGQLPADDPALASADFPGWCSVLRCGWNTPDETALWLVHGSTYRDHCHDDLGSFVLYALGAPLSIDWGAIYYPHVAGGFLHNTVLPEAAIGCPWDKDGPPLDAGPRWAATDAHAFLAFRHSAQARARFRWRDGTLWTRSITLLHPSQARPAILIRDTFEGPSAGSSKILTLNLMAQGDVDTPAGPASPPLRTFHHDREPKELPSAGKPFELKPGLSRLGFAGQWLIDCDVYTLSPQAQQGEIGNWAHAWHPGAEQSEFRKAQGRPFEERQHILRVRGNGPFATLLLPRRKGEPRDALAVRGQDDAFRLAAEGEAACLDDQFATWQQGGRLIETSFGGQHAFASGVTVDGGPIEVVVEKGRVVLTAHGGKGLRRVKLPGTWQPQEAKAPVDYRDGEWRLDYAGGSPVTVILRR